MKLWTTTDIAWMAGIIEGEGTIQIQKDNRQYISVKMTDRDIIERLHAMGIGTMIQMKRTPSWKPHYKDQWMWKVSRTEDLLRLVTAISPLMGVRRSEKIAELLDRLTERLAHRLCPECEEMFPPRNSGSTFCSRKCVNDCQYRKLKVRLEDAGLNTYQYKKLGGRIDATI